MRVMRKWFRLRKRFRFKSATKLALFSTAMILAVMLVLYAFLSATFEARLLAYTQSEILPGGDMADRSGFVLLMAAICIAPLAYGVSALIIDRTLNPVRVMIEKVKSVGRRDFNSRIFIDSAEDELTEYAIAFNQMSSKIGAYVESQKRFISDASHELVTPLAVIIGHADMLLRWGKEDPQALTDGLSIIKTEALAMNELVENLLFFARADNQRMVYDKQTLALTPLLTDMVTEQRRLHPGFDIRLETPPEPLYIYADSEAFKRVLRILFANSVKYSETVKQISVTAERTTTHALLSVSDSGIGIAAECIPRIFDRFYRVDDSRTRDTGGTGLGLAIAKEILDAHGFGITTRSEPGQGTTQTIQLS